jgi:hypothetical protein
VRPIIVEHVHDADAGVYRLVIGYEIIEVIPMTDEEGQVLFSDYEELEGIVDGEEAVVRRPVGDPMTEQVRTVVPVEDFVFSDTDERWDGKSDEEVAASQIRSVRRVLKKREEAAADQPTPRKMPGAGRAL